jgi:hypothetical protein
MYHGKLKRKKIDKSNTYVEGKSGLRLNVYELTDCIILAIS